MKVEDPDRWGGMQLLDDRPIRRGNNGCITAFQGLAGRREEQATQMRKMTLDVPEVGTWNSRTPFQTMPQARNVNAPGTAAGSLINGAGFVPSAIADAPIR